MAYVAQFGSMVDELVAAVTSLSDTQQEQRNACREFVSRNLRHHNFNRTNQFEVTERLDGLEERFCVVGRDALAEALRARLDALEPYRNRTTPEVLHLLLELADQPTQKSKLSDLDALYEPEEEAPPPLTWRDIAREDGWKQERDIWRFVDYSLGSSDEEELDLKSEASLESLTTASSTEDKSQRNAGILATKSQGPEALTPVRDAQAWRQSSATDAEGRSRKIPVTTTQLLRECLFMIAGLETSLFDAGCNPVSKYQLQDTSWESHKALVSSFAEYGRKLAPLRAFARGQEESALLQIFQECVQQALHSLDLELSNIQTGFVTPNKDLVVSLIAVLEALDPLLAPRFALADIVRQVQEERNPHAFRYLELLYDAVAMAQLQGNRATYHLLGTVFFDCFQVYLKPIRLWMEEGKLVPGDRTFFVSESPTKLPLSQIWKSGFNLLRTPEGNLHAPRFLRPAIHRIFTAGKSIVVLKHLKQHASTQKYRSGAEPKMDFATVCPADLELAPFSELFTAAFQNWIQSKHHTAAATLRELLFSAHGLSESLDALQRVYLMSDGARADAFAASVFRHLDRGSHSWRDRFTLTELAQEAFSAAAGGAGSCVDSFRLSADVDLRGSGSGSGLDNSTLAGAHSSVRLALPAIRLHYRLSWPVQLVIGDDGIRGYQEIFTFLLQSRRALYVLHQQHQHSTLPIPSHHHTPNHTPDPPSYYRLRTSLTYFTTTLLAYLTTLVLSPATSILRTNLSAATDVDDMVAAHASFISRVRAQACFATPSGGLRPIREAVLDVLDLAVRLGIVRGREVTRWARERGEVGRLVGMASPFRGGMASPFRASVLGGEGGGGGMAKGRGRRGGRGYEEEDEDEDESDDGEDGDGDADGPRGGDWVGRRRGEEDGVDKPYALVLREMQQEYERHLRFVAGGLRGVARASKEEAAAKWDLLAEMLEVGIKD